MSSSIAPYQQAVDSGVIVAQDLLVMAAPWEQGVTMPETDLFDAEGLIDTVVTELELVTLGRIDQKGGASFTPDASYEEIMGYGARAPRRRILQTEGMDITVTPQEVRKITLMIQNNLEAGSFDATGTGGFRAKKLAGTPPKYWSLFFLGLDWNEETGEEILPWWFFAKTGSDKGGKVSLAPNAPMMGELTSKLFQDGDNLYEFGIDGAGWADLAGDLGFGEATSYTATITGTPTGGTFTLTIGGQTTSGIAYNATATAVRSALEALSSVGVGHVSVTGSAGGPYTITFDPSVSGTLTGTASLTGGTTPNITVTAV